MTNHQKRLAVPNSWPVERKTETFTTKAGAGPHGEAGVPLVIVLRDVLGYVDSKKEARYALNQDAVLVNGDAVSDEARPIGMFDILAFVRREEYYRVFPDEGGRLALTPIDADAAGSRLGKVVGKTQVTGGDFQLTLHDGTTLAVEDGAAYDTDDSLVIDNETKEIVAHFEFEEGERYEYEVFMQNEGEGTFVWEVQDVSGGQMTVYTEYDVGDTYYESTVTGQEGSMRGQVMSTPAGSFMAVALFSPATSYYEQGTLEVGNSWEASSPEGSARFEVVRKDSYSGVECFYSELYSDGELVHESCVNPELGLAVYSVYYEQETGDRELEMTLVGYSR